MTTLRELIASKSQALRYPDQLTPDEASKHLVELSSLLSTINKEAAETLYWLNCKKQEFLKEHGSAAKARIYSDASPEWLQWRERVEQKEAVLEMIRALKFFLKNASEEKRESVY